MTGGLTGCGWVEATLEKRVGQALRRDTCLPLSARVGKEGSRWRLSRDRASNGRPRGPEPADRFDKSPERVGRRFRIRPHKPDRRVFRDCRGNASGDAVDGAAGLYVPVPLGTARRVGRYPDGCLCPVRHRRGAGDARRPLPLQPPQHVEILGGGALSPGLAGGSDQRRVQPVGMWWPLRRLRAAKGVLRLVAAQQQLAAHREHDRLSLAPLNSGKAEAAAQQLQLRLGRHKLDWRHAPAQAISAARWVLARSAWAAPKPWSGADAIGAPSRPTSSTAGSPWGTSWHPDRRSHPSSTWASSIDRASNASSSRAARSRAGSPGASTPSSAVRTARSAARDTTVYCSA